MSEVSVSAEAPLQADAEWQVRVGDDMLTQLPEDLFIPPEALRVFLETFEGPLDLLLYLIRRHNLDILSINVAQITHQYLEYVELMHIMQIELAAEYLLMAAMLAEIKSRSLLPRPPKDDDDEEEADPRAELIRRLLEYERFKNAAEALEALPRWERDLHPVAPALPELEKRVLHPDVDLREVLVAMASVVQRAELKQEHQVAREPLSTRARMSDVLDALGEQEQFMPFESLFPEHEGKAGIVVTFMAVLELIKEKLVELVQQTPYAPIYVRRRPAQDESVLAAEDESAMNDRQEGIEF